MTSSFYFLAAAVLAAQAPEHRLVAMPVGEVEPPPPGIMVMTGIAPRGCHGPGRIRFASPAEFEWQQARWMHKLLHFRRGGLASRVGHLCFGRHHDYGMRLPDASHYGAPGGSMSHVPDPPPPDSKDTDGSKDADGSAAVVGPAYAQPVSAAAPPQRVFPAVQAYTQLTGRLQYVANGQGHWLLHYTAGPGDRLGGAVVLSTAVNMAEFRHGDTVTVVGEVLNVASPLGAPVYRAQTVELVGRTR